MLIRVPGWEGCWLSQMRTFASRLAGVSLSLAVLCLHPHVSCTSAGFASLLAATPLATYGKGRVRWVTDLLFFHLPGHFRLRHDAEQVRVQRQALPHFAQ